MKNTIAAIALSLSAFAHAAPSADNYASVTNDWYQGNWTNVYELAQQRLAANTNDLVASHLMVSYDILFSDYQAISNSILRLVGALDSVTEPSLTNLCAQLRPGWVYYLDEFLPQQTDAVLQEQRAKSQITHKTLDCDFILEQISASGLWTPLLQ